MKKVLVVHFGSWFDEQQSFSYENQINLLVNFLNGNGIFTERMAKMPLVEELVEYSGVIFVSLSFKKEAKMLRRSTDKKVFMISGLIEAGDDAFGVIPINKKIGWHKVADLIDQEINA